MASVATMLGTALLVEHALRVPTLVATALVALGGPLAVAAVGGYGPDVRAHAGVVRWAGRLTLASVLAAWSATLVVATAFGVAAVPLAPLAATSALLPHAWLLGRRLAEVPAARVRERVVVLGSGEVARRLEELTRLHSSRALEIVGYIDDDEAMAGGSTVPRLGRVDDLPQLLATDAVDRLMVAFSRRNDGELARLVRACHDFDVDVDVVPRLFDVLGPAPRTYGLGALPVLSVASPRRSPVGLALKRGFDVVVSALTLAALAPLMALIAGAMMLESGRPVLFMQRRLGRDGAPFDVVKFRTMASGPAGSGQELLLAAAGPDAIAATVASIKAGSALYVTRVGRLLRKTSLDELPQLWNVLAGQMSIVGPRPLRDFEVAALEDWQQLRQRMRPGITGLWQVLGRGEVEWDERMLLDYSYVRHWSLGADLRILAGTVPAVMTQRGAL